jgi:hypothetical protein
MCTQTTVIATRNESDVCNQAINLEELSPCNHEEAYTRLFLHVKHAALAGYKVCMVNASDTDVLVIAVSVLPVLQDLGLEKLWMAFCQGQNLRWIPIHDVHSYIGIVKSREILFFHALTGYDVVSSFRGKEKNSAWQTLDICPEVCDVLLGSVNIHQ